LVKRQDDHCTAFLLPKGILGEDEKGGGKSGPGFGGRMGFPEGLSKAREKGRKVIKKKKEK